MYSAVRRLGVLGALAIALPTGIATSAARASDVACTPAALVRTVRQGEAATSATIHCTNVGAAPIDYTITGGTAWVTVTLPGAQGLAPGESVDHVVSFDPVATGVGAHLATLVVDSGAADDPHVPVTLVVAQSTLPSPIVLQPGSQPPEVANDLGLRAEYPGFVQAAVVDVAHSRIPTPGSQACVSCHANTETGGGPILNEWDGSMMAHASRDPVMWAALAVAEKAIPGVGDTCLRCHVPKGWLAGRSVPSTGSALTSTDADGVTCMLCHRLARPDASDGITGVQSPPFAATDPIGGASLLGSAMFSLFQNASVPEDIARLGPYALGSLPSHDTIQSPFHRSGDLCGTCHDVSNPIVGDLAPGHGTLPGMAPTGGFSGDPQGEVTAKAAFQLPPHAYGIEQRTYSEWLASGFATARVADFGTLPAELQKAGGAVQQAYAAALAAGTGGDYVDGTPRTFTCQSCHMPPTFQKGCISGSARKDTPLHRFVGGNHFAPDAIRYLDDPARFTGNPALPSTSRLRIGGGLLDAQWNALAATPANAAEALQSAVSLSLLQDRQVLANTVRITNLTGHKLPSGYPDGRRMWLRVRWYDADGALVREDGAYGDALTEDLDGDMVPDTIRTLLDPGARVYEVHGGISREWAICLVTPLGAPCGDPEPSLRGLGLDPGLVVAYDAAGDPVTLGSVEAGAPGSVVPTFQLALNDRVVSDTRIPPWGLDYAAARERNALPVPADQYIDAIPAQGTDAVYRHYDDVALDPPAGAVRAEAALLYQSTSWEYVRFLWKAGATASDPFLEGAGADLLEAWRATGMAEPVVMAQITVPEPGAAGAGAAALGSLGLAMLRRRRGGRGRR